MKNENRDYCKHIAETLEAYADGDMYKCPHCENVHTFSEYAETEHENADGETVYTCPNCGGEVEENELEAVFLYDYFNDVFDIEYRCNSRHEYRSVSVMVACGGPNIYIDTKRRAVLLYWWNESAEYPLTNEAVNAVDAWAEELFNC